MTWVKGKSGNPGGRGVNKLFADVLRMELAAAGNDHKALRAIARNLIALAQKPERLGIASAEMIADRLDGKPAQESTVTFEKRDESDWSRDELVAILNDATKGREDAAEVGRRGEQLN